MQDFKAEEVQSSTIEPEAPSSVSDGVNEDSLPKIDEEADEDVSHIAIETECIRGGEHSVPIIDEENPLYDGNPTIRQKTYTLRCYECARN